MTLYLPLLFQSFYFVSVDLLMFVILRLLILGLQYNHCPLHTEVGRNKSTRINELGLRYAGLLPWCVFLSVISGLLHYLV